MKLLLLFFLTTFTGAFAQTGLVPFRISDSWGYSDTSGKIVIEPKYIFTEFFENGVAFVKTDTGAILIDTLGRFLAGPFQSYGRFTGGICPVMKTPGMAYYIDSRGKQLFGLSFNAAENFSEGLAVVSVGRKLGIIDMQGRWVRKPDFDTSSVYFKSGFLMGISGGKYFYINRRGETLKLADTVQPAGIFSEGLAAVYVSKSRNSAGQKIKTVVLEFIDSSGRIALSGFVNDGIDYSEYIDIEKEFRDGKAIIKSRNEIGWDYFFLDRKKRFSPLYSAARQLGDSLFLGAIGYYMSDVRILDSNYYVAGPFQTKPTQIGEFGNGLIPFRNKDGLWGYVNSNCRAVIPEKYSLAYNFRDGYAIVIVNGKPGYINTRGKEFFYDLK